MVYLWFNTRSFEDRSTEKDHKFGHELSIKAIEIWGFKTNWYLKNSGVSGSAVSCVIHLHENLADFHPIFLCKKCLDDEIIDPSNVRPPKGTSSCFQFYMEYLMLLPIWIVNKNCNHGWLVLFFRRSCSKNNLFNCINSRMANVLSTEIGKINYLENSVKYARIT